MTDRPPISPAFGTDCIYANPVRIPMQVKAAPARAISAIVSLVLVVPSIAFADTTVRCESSGYRYSHCPVDTNGRVSLERQLSSIKCREGDNWGYDHRGVWVDKGCGAEFRVTGGGGGGHDKALAAGAAIAGIAIIAALASRNGNQNADVAPWAVGTFQGYDGDERANVELTILPGGSVSGNASSRDFTGHLRGDQLEAGRHTFRIAQLGNGFVATDVNNSGHRVHFQRTGGGY
jgi:hypothetical protein